MSLQTELNLKKPPATKAHEAFLSVYFTGTCIKKMAARFLSEFGLSDVQFNLLMMLKHQGSKDGLTQAQLSDMLLVNRPNITGLVDRMEKASLIRRQGDPEDRRANRITLTPKSRKLVDKVDPIYGREMHRVMSGLNNSQINEMIQTLEIIRQKISE